MNMLGGNGRVSDEKVGNRLAKVFFAGYDCTKSLGKVDFSVVQHSKVNTKPIAMGVFFKTSKGTISVFSSKTGYGFVTYIYNPLVLHTLTLGRSCTFKTNLSSLLHDEFDAAHTAIILYEGISFVFSFKKGYSYITSYCYTSYELATLYNVVKLVLDKQLYHVRNHIKDKGTPTFIEQNLNENPISIACSESDVVGIYHGMMQLGGLFSFQETRSNNGQKALTKILSKREREVGIASQYYCFLCILFFHKIQLQRGVICWILLTLANVEGKKKWEGHLKTDFMKGDSVCDKNQRMII